MGFILRLTESNGYDTPAWILELSRLNHIRFSYSCPFVFRESSGLTGLSSLTGVALSELAKLICPRAKTGDNSQEEHLFFGAPVPKYLIRVVRTKICPGCLRESNYNRKFWDLSAVTACPVHGVLLLDQCPNCRRRILWTRRKVSICTCGFDWREADLEFIQGSELKVTGHIYRLCGYQFPGGEVRDGETNPLLGLNLNGFLSNLLFIAGQQQNIPDTEIVGLGVKNFEIHARLLKAYAVFENWPHRFHAFLEWQRKNHYESGRCPELDTRLAKGFGSFYTRLYSKSGVDSFELLRNAFAGYVTRHWGGSRAKRTGWRYVVMAANGRKYVSKREAIRQLRIDRLCLDRHIEEGRLETGVLKDQSTSECLVEVSSLEKLKRELSPGVDITEAVALIGVNKRSLKRLVTAGLLEALRGPTADGTRNWRFSQDAIESLMKKMEGAMIASDAALVGDELSFHQALRRVCSFGTKMEDFFRAILGGQLTPCRLIPGVGVARFRFKEVRVVRFALSVKSARVRRFSQPVPSSRNELAGRVNGEIY